MGPYKSTCRGWKGDMVKGHVLKGIKPEWKHFPNQHQYWDELIHFKLSKAEQAVTIDTLLKRRYRCMIDLDILGQDGKKLLKENMGCIVAWCKRYISFDSKS
ncbi:hypothetical protein C2845_PM12G10120 [Panicum miliaceum]|uniref:Uncharacterized protein n=1 Tax=Panicum miliaceum TaxID=4540 RepID=A0A3L6QDM3_PANMI|nr:hypothetical protein C2845_PM12G10120 [Panicum miliaceum]